MSDHVLVEGECPICDASEIATLKTQYAGEVAEVSRLRAALATAEREAAKFQAMSEADIAERRAAERMLEAERGVVVACTRRAEAAEARAQRAVEVLRDVEWSDNSGEEYAPCCPACGWVTNDAGKHRPGCALAAVLAEGKGENRG